MKNQIIPDHIEQPKPEVMRVKAEEVELVVYGVKPGGPLGRITYFTVEHPEYGLFSAEVPLPMSEEACLEWVEVMVPVHRFKAGEVKFELPDRHPREVENAGLWMGDPADEVRKRLNEGRGKGDGAKD